NCHRCHGALARHEAHDLSPRRQGHTRILECVWGGGTIAHVPSESQRWSPHAVWYVAPVMYGGAALVGVSRMYNIAHWASDVVLGAGIGTFPGIKVVRYSRGHSNNPIDRWLLGSSVIPIGGGRVVIAWSSADHSKQR